MGTDYDPNSFNAVLSRMEQRQIANGEKLDGLVRWTHEHEGKDHIAFKDLGDRIGVLERFRWYLAGAVAVIVFFVELIFRFVLK